MKTGSIALGGILTECNEFSINLMTKENFERYEYFEGADILNLNSGVVGGMLNIINNTAFEISPTVCLYFCHTGLYKDDVH